MRIRPAHLLLAGALFITPITACGGSSKKDSTTTSSSSGSSTSTTASGSSAGSGHSDLVTYCTDVDNFIKDAQKALQTRSEADLNALESRGNDLASRGERIAPTIKTSTDVAQLTACEKKFTDLAQQFATAFPDATG